MGETTYLAASFPNVIIDFTGVGWMTPARFRAALAEWLAVVPHNKMCWGSDSISPENIAGIDSIMPRLIADIVEDAISERLIGEKYAPEFMENSYVNTDKRVFEI